MDLLTHSAFSSFPFTPSGSSLGTVDELSSGAWSYYSHAIPSAWWGFLRFVCNLMTIRVRIELCAAVFAQRKVATDR